MSAASLPTIRVAGALTDALTADALSQLGTAQLAAFLLQRRWFGGKGRAPVRVGIGDVVEIRHGDLRAAVVRLDVDTGAEKAVYYQLPLAVRQAGGSEPLAVLARVEAGAERGLLFDAVEDESFRVALGSAFVSGATFGGASARGGTKTARWIVEPIATDRSAPVRLAGLPSRTVRAEQSNTSIIFGNAAILKLFRRMEPGLNPDVEIGRFLTTRTSFTNTPALLGVIRYEGSDGTDCIAGMLQHFLSGSTDAWQDTLQRSRLYFTRHTQNDATHPFSADAERIGQVTRELHDALASPSEDAAFVPRRTLRVDVERWAASARQRIEESIALLAASVETGGVVNEHGARGVIEERDSYLHRIDELIAIIGDDAGQMIRHHGDYHLGQVLRTDDGDYQIIDFEGEPARPLAERRDRNSALRDVAGMLRSFAYAGATMAAEQAGKSNAAEMEQRAAAWERGARAAFLHGYLGEASAPFLPSATRAVDAMRELFETEKVFYELSYELNNRPAWVWIPIAGATTLRATPAGQP